MNLKGLNEEQLVQLKMEKLMQFKITDSYLEKIKLNKEMEEIDHVRLERAIKYGDNR